MAKSLVMSFSTEGGKKVSYTLNNVRDDITEANVSVVMNAIISKNIFTTSSGDLKVIDSASITDKNVTALSVK